MKLYHCSECTSRFIKKDSLKTHISFAHENHIGSICPICGKRLITDTVLKKHISFMHEGKARPKFKCTLCNESFSTKKTLEGHMSVHEGKIFQCSNCDEEFNSKIKLEVHIAKVPFIYCVSTFRGGWGMAIFTFSTVFTPNRSSRRKKKEWRPTHFS